MMARTGLKTGSPRLLPPAGGDGYGHGVRSPIVAFAYALMSLYWALGGHALISTTRGYV
jgi:hypothetical protein